MTKTPDDDLKWLSSLDDALNQLPKDYPAAYARISDMRHQFIARIASAIEGRLNEHFCLVPHGTLAEKQQIASAVNQDLRALNLCVECPHTSDAAILVADFSHDPDTTSRFRFQVSDKNGRQTKKGGYPDLPELTVREAPPRKEQWARSRSTPGEGRTYFER